MIHNPYFEDITSRGRSVIIKKILTSVALAVMMTLGVGSVTANAAPPLPPQPAVIQVSNTYWQYNYYDNHFYWLYTCAARGNEMKRTVPGVVDYHCHYDFPDTKWSMDVQWRWI